MSNNLGNGKKGEDIAADYLTKNGYTLLERNWRKHHWEVDIIASKDQFLHFIEVKTRYSLRFGFPEESISKDKMKNLKNAAENYQYQHLL